MQKRVATPHSRSGWWPRGANPHSGSGGCMGAGGPRGVNPRSRSGGVAVRRYPSFEVRETQVRWYVLLDGIRGQTH